MIHNLQKVTVKAPSNIAIIKYWGKKDPKLNLPYSSTISANYSNLFTQTTVEFDSKLKKDVLIINGKSSDRETSRASALLDVIRKRANIKTFARVVSKNNFPTASGLASSASGFAALTIASAKAAGLNLSERELTTIARLGSGSACRSIPTGIVKWEKGTNDKSSYAHSIFKPNYWDIDMLALLVSSESKKTPSTDGHKIAQTSPLFEARVKNLEKKVKTIEKALKEKNFKLFGEMLEEEALELHSIALTSTPPIIYLEPKSIEIMKLCHTLRDKNILVYFTFDAGPQPILFCLPKDTSKIVRSINSQINGIKIIKSKIGEGAKIINNHLF